MKNIGHLLPCRLPRWVTAKQQLADTIGSSCFDVEVAHLGEAKSHIAEAESAGVLSVPALVIGGRPFHIKFDAAITDQK